MSIASVHSYLDYISPVTPHITRLHTVSNFTSHTEQYVVDYTVKQTLNILLHAIICTIYTSKAAFTTS